MMIDGGPRKGMNTSQMGEAFAKGVKSVSDEIEVKTVRLYDLDYKGCRSCMACKLKNKWTNVCVFKDGLQETLNEVACADGLVLLSPIYCCDITAQLRAFFERLTFPWLNYVDLSSVAPRRIPSALVYTMNAPEEQAKMILDNLRVVEWLVSRGLGDVEQIVAYNTYQVKDYGRYEFPEGYAQAKQAYKDARWQADIQNAFDAGKRMAEKILA